MKSKRSINPIFSNPGSYAILSQLQLREEAYWYERSRKGTRPESKQELRRFYKDHIDSWALSEQTQFEYCRQNNLRYNRFTYWKIKFQNERQPVELVQVPTNLFAREPGTPLRLSIGKQFTFEIPEGFSAETLEQILKTLRRF